MPVSTDHNLTVRFLQTIYTIEEPEGVLRHRRRPVWMFKDGRHNSAEQNCNMWNTRYAGKVVGALNSNGHLQTRINTPDGRELRIQVHNIIQKLRTGKWPKKEVDHVNRDGVNNTADNLRLASRSQQNINQGIRRDNTTGVRGVSRNGNGWLARLKLQGELVLCKTYADFSDAVTARKDAERRYFGKYNPPTKGELK